MCLFNWKEKGDFAFVSVNESQKLEQFMWVICFMFKQSRLRNDLLFLKWKKFLSSILHTQGSINSVNYIQKAIYMIVNYSKWCQWSKGTPICNEGNLCNGYPEECLLKCEDTSNWWSDKLNTSSSGLEGAACEKLRKHCDYFSD